MLKIQKQKNTNFIISKKLLKFRSGFNVCFICVFLRVSKGFYTHAPSAHNSWLPQTGPPDDSNYHTVGAQKRLWQYILYRHFQQYQHCSHPRPSIVKGRWAFRMFGPQGYTQVFMRVWFSLFCYIAPRLARVCLCGVTLFVFELGSKSWRIFETNSEVFNLTFV